MLRLLIFLAGMLATRRPGGVAARPGGRYGRAEILPARAVVSPDDRVEFTDDGYLAEYRDL